jgi:hypothetical protein
LTDSVSFIRENIKDEDTKKELIDFFESDEVKFAQTILAMLVIQTLVSQEDVHLFISAKGACHISDSETIDDIISVGSLMNKSYIKLPLRMILADFISHEDLIDTDIFDQLGVFTKAEQKVLDLMRKGGLKSLKVRFDEGSEVTLIEAEDTLNVKANSKEFSELMIAKKYRTISYTTHDEKVMNINRVTKIKP